MRVRRLTHIPAITLTIVAILPCLAVAQQESHTHRFESMIDGSIHPELIPDSSAYRLYFIVVSEAPGATEEQKIRQLAYLRRIGLRPGDLDSLIKGLEIFKVEYDDLIATYNKTAEAATAAGLKPDVDELLLQRNLLVEATRGELKRSLTEKGMLLLDAHVQREKSHMKVPEKETQ